MKNSMTGQLTKFYEAAWLDLPVAAAQRWLGGNPKSLRVAGWAAYDSFVALANEMTNQMYANPLVASTFGRTLETAFHIQHIFDALAPSSPAASPAPLALDSVEIEPADAVAAAAAEETPRVTLAPRGAHYAEAAAQYRTASRVPRPRRAAA
jgi:hypothetical protein